MDIGQVILTLALFGLIGAASHFNRSVPSDVSGRTTRRGQSAQGE